MRTNCWRVLPRSCASQAWKACRRSMRRSAVSLPVRCTKRLRSAKSWASGPAIWTTVSAGASTARARKWWLCSVIWMLCPPATAGPRPSRFPAKSKTTVFTDAARWTTRARWWRPSTRWQRSRMPDLLPPSASVCCSAPTKKPAAAICRGTFRMAASCRCTASRRTANTRSSTAKRAFSTALTAESCTRPAITA